MTHESPARDAVEVTQADRDAAKSLLGRDDAGPSWWSIDSGNADSDQMVQAFARHRIAHQSTGELEMLREALNAVHAAILNGGDGVKGDFGWSITALNKARPLIRAALKGTSNDQG
jgi:hypothetical protein